MYKVHGLKLYDVKQMKRRNTYRLNIKEKVKDKNYFFEYDLYVNHKGNNYITIL